MGFFNRQPLDFDSRLSRIINPPNGIFRRAPIDKGQTFVGLVAQDPTSAAQSEAALDFLRHLANHREGHYSATAVAIMFGKAPNEFTKSRNFGDALGALAGPGKVFAGVALETFESAVKNYGPNVAANPSTAAAVVAISSASYKGAMAKAISELASDRQNAAAFASNPGLARIISTLTQTAMGDAGTDIFEAAIGLFEAAEGADPVALRRNESSPQALDALEGLRDSRCLANREGLDPELTQRINDIVVRAQQPLEPSRGL